MRTLSRRKPWIANLALLAGSFALALGGAELVLRALYESDYEIHPRGLYSADPAVGYVPTPGFTGTFVRDEYAHGVTIGNSGLRGADPRPRRPETYRIVCLGDSFTWGLGWAAFGLSVIALFERRPLAYHLINGGYLTVAFVVMGLILALWK